MFSGAINKNLVLESATQGRVLWATMVAIVLHLVGLVGMLWIDRAWFAALTPFNLLLMAAAIVWTQTSRPMGFVVSIFVAFAAGMMSESIGVNTGILFGDYLYGTVLGPRIFGVPLIIGFNWFMVTFSAAAAVGYLLDNLSTLLFKHDGSAVGKGAATILLHASLAAAAATLFDWVMEPVAVKLGFWTWTGDEGIPILNYVCWFLLSWLLVAFMKVLRVDTRNLFAANLFLVQILFFMVLRLLL